MTVSVEMDKDSHNILAVYIKIHSGTIARTVEIEEDACYADEDSEGRLLGVEMLAPGQVTILADKIAKHYKTTEIDDILEQARHAFV